MFRISRTDYLSLTDEQLMERISKAERNAFEILYDRYFNKLVWFARGFVEDVQCAEDIVQEVFIKLIDNHNRFDLDKKFSTWIYVITSNRCKHYLRDEKNRLRILRENVIPFKDEKAELNSTSDFKLLKERIQLIYVGLSEKEKNIYSLRFEQELGIKEISVIMNIPEGSVKSGIYYLLKKLAQQLKDFSHEY
ncbi:RNA polymerase sigma factor [Aurantibacillus circumpalustris]|uniref:RNA polymerase sigma factor n=1 Tax=Aurantibacillus circumpalustris TaxID=3036359 RepID=UPI00295B24F4|nr:RNA polymerase sigma factor [Aurantibacillus circumpalustris]